jgi:hypothetical protein
LRVLEALKLTLHSVLDRQALENSLSDHEELVFIQMFELDVFGGTSAFILLG